MKMVMAVVLRDHADIVMENLITAGYGATFTESRGGMLRQARQLIFTAVEKEELEKVIGIIKKYCRTQVQVESGQPFAEEGEEEGEGEEEEAAGASSRRQRAVVTDLGGAAVFVWDLDKFETY
ncbi:MAG: cyclic-di-AMP receptor [Anaerolineales bacterium]